ncbi:MAG: hypothetical protein R3A52_05925 [Polyangiales bacterium]
MNAPRFEVDRPVRIIMTSSCRPACDTLVSRECSLTREGDAFTIRGTVVVDAYCRTTPPPVCSKPEVGCETPPLPAGRYTVTDGTHTVTVEIPSAVPLGGVCSALL